MRYGQLLLIAVSLLMPAALHAQIVRQADGKYRFQMKFIPKANYLFVGTLGMAEFKDYKSMTASFTVETKDENGGYIRSQITIPVEQPDPPITQRFTGYVLFNGEGLDGKKFAHQLFPPKPVRLGESWTYAEPGAAELTNLKATFASIESKGNYDCAKITATGKFGGQNVTGVYFYNLQDGWLQSMRFQSPDKKQDGTDVSFDNYFARYVPTASHGLKKCQACKVKCDPKWKFCFACGVKLGNY